MAVFLAIRFDLALIQLLDAQSILSECCGMKFHLSVRVNAGEDNVKKYDDNREGVEHNL